MNLVIVESPAKAKTINKYLGKDYLVLASYGHIRDLPSKNGSVDPENKFQMEWEIDSFSKKYLKEITNAAEDSDKIILATDPDREGEAIAWHVKEVLDKKKLLKDKHLERVVFNEITKKAILDAIKNPREIHLPLVEAYLARPRLSSKSQMFTRPFSGSLPPHHRRRLSSKTKTRITFIKRTVSTSFVALPSS